MRNNAWLVLVFLVLMGVAAPFTSQVAQALTPHEDYAKFAIKDCNACHKESGVTPNHLANWDQEHRLFAEKMPNNCKSCHQLSYCMDCHFGGGLTLDLQKSTNGPDYMPRSHKTDFREIHPIKAFDDPRSCYRCHDAEKFCADCHSRFKPDELAPISHRKGFSLIELTSVGPAHEIFNESQCQTCHPGGMLPEHRWSSGHAREARKNLKTCQACHPDGDVCLKCHSARTGLMINPHPRNWDKVSGRYSSRAHDRTCVVCH
jgi:hypothetical protein